MKPRWLPLLAPVLLLVAIRVVPLAAGEKTLFVRDVLNTHLALRATLAEGIRAGSVPTVDPLRGGGQPLAGNPNVVPFYPDNLLLLIASPLWQLNAHFWLHWLLAFAAAVWLGRAWGLGREGAAATGAAYALSGFFVAQLNLYNAVAGAALAPGLAAALLETGEAPTRRRGLLLAALLWALSLLGGDPILAALALAAGLTLAFVRHGRALPRLALVAALALGSLVAAPQLVETLRILGESYRGFWGYGGMVQARTAPAPAAAIDLVVPLFFGRPDLRQLWGTAYFGGFPPLYFSLAPGWIVLALTLAGLGRGRRAGGVLALVVVGLVAAFSGGTPWGGAFAALPAGGLFRFPVKFALWAALGGALLAGLGLERALEGPRRRFLTAALGAAALAGGGLWLALSLGRSFPAEGLLTEGLGAAARAAERTRWAGIVLLATLGAVVALALWRLLPQRWRTSALLAVHAGGQLVLLGPMLPVDETAPYRERPALARELPAGSRLAHAGVGEIFGPGWGAGAAADPRLVQLARRAQAELHPFAGRPLGFAYELDSAPDGLDTFVTHAVARGMKGFSDARRLAVLEAFGVERLLLFRPLEAAAEARARLAGTFEAETRVWIYELERPLPTASLLGRAVFAPTMNAALEQVFAPGFEADGVAVVAGDGAPRDGPRGSVATLVDEPERMVLEVDSASGGFLLLRRAHLSLWRATVDGRDAPTRIAQLTRLAVELPPGRHEVVLRISRAPRRWAWLAATVGLLGLLALHVDRRRR